MTFKPSFGQITILSLSLVNFRVSRFHVSHLTHETFKLCLQNTLNMLKTARVYFGVLQIVKELTNSLGQWQRTKTICNTYIDRGDLTEANKVCFYWANSVLTPSKHVLTMRQESAILLYALVKGWNLNVGKIVEQFILDYVENNFSMNIPHPSLITRLCIKGRVTFRETKEKCPRSSPLTLIGVLKTLTHGEEVERARKRKRTATELPREATPAAEEEP